ncbi:hypothetical protein [Roseobacter weihaiensis]|uniref:hypothetical protein n=1 Tax=Roseobacter weihaiensis TaxID=2763262 RepID=UPI001D0BBEB4|nr:hypothetical protein [Roseobacter sp. H9]
MILDNFNIAQSRPLIPLPADKQPTIFRWRQKECACRGEIGGRIEVMRNADCVREDLPVYIGVMRNIDATHKLDQISRLGAKMRLFGVNGLANKIDRHGIFSHFRCALIPCLRLNVKNYRAPHMHDNSFFLSISVTKMHAGFGRFACGRTTALVEPCHVRTSTTPSILKVKGLRLSP